MARKGENIYKRKDGRWEGRFIKNRTETGKAIYGYIYGKTYTEVRNRLLYAKANTVNNFIDDKPQSEILFEEVAWLWINDISSSIKLSTRNKYINLLKLYMIPTFKNYNLSEINKITFDKYINHLLTKGGCKGTGLSSKTVGDIISVYRSITKYAINKNINVAFDGTGIYVKRTIQSMRILSVSEQSRMIKYLSSNMNLCNLGILLTLSTGIRLGELCALCWDDISYEDNVIHIQKTMQRVQVQDGLNKTQVIITSPKSSCSVRDIPIPEHLRLLLNEYKDNTGYFLTGSKSKYIEPRTMENKLKKITEVCNIKDFHFHSLRHTFATRCIETGFDVKCLSEILGHSDVSITLNRYVHPTLELKAHHMNKLSEIFSVN